MLKTNALFLILFALAGCGQQKATEAAPPLAAPPLAVPANTNLGQVVIAPDSPKLAQIKTEQVETVPVPLSTVFAPGKVEANANRLSHVVLPISGRINSVLVKIGDLVKQGQPVLSIESSDADAAVAAYQQAQATVTQSKSALAKAQKDFDRQKDLFEHGATPEKEVFNTQAIAVQAQAAVEQTQANVEQTKRKLQLLGIGANSYGQRVSVGAPLAGKVLELTVVTGEFRNDLSASLMTIADLSSVWVSSDVPETAIRLVKIGEGVRIELAAYPGETFRGRVTQIGDTVDPQTRTVKVRAEMANLDGRLKPEMFGSILLSAQIESRPTVAAAAIIAGEGRSIVWRQTGPGTFEKVTVTTSALSGNRVAVLTGLRSTDRVVVEGVMLLGGI